jgi:hypothetical protein
MHSAPFSKIFIPTPFNHRLAGLVGDFYALIWLQPNKIQRKQLF